MRVLLHNFLPCVLLLTLLSCLQSDASEIAFGFYDYSDFPSGNSNVSQQFMDGLALAFDEYNLQIVRQCDHTFKLQPLPQSSINTADVVAVVGPIDRVTFQSLRRRGMPMIAPLILDGLDEPHLLVTMDPLVVNLRASRRDEALVLLRHFRAVMAIELIAVVYEEGFVSMAELEALSVAANASGLELLGRFAVSQNSSSSLNSSIAATLRTLELSLTPLLPDAILVMGSVSVASQIVQASRQWSDRALSVYGIVTLGDPADIATSLNSNLTNVFLTQAVPSSSNVSSDSASLAQPLVAAARTLSRSFPPTGLRIEGYLAGQLMTQWIQKIHPKDCTESFTASRLLDLIYGCCCTYPIGDLQVGPFVNGSCSQGLHTVWILKGDGGSFVPMESFAFPNSCVIDVVSTFQPKALVFGQSAPFSGPSAPNGPQLRAGILAAFAEQNKFGGVFGRKLHLISLDDGYVVERAFVNTAAFLKVGVYALLGYYGTAVSNNVSVMAAVAAVPYLAPFTGSFSLRNSSNFNRFIVNVRASYPDEVNAFVRYATMVLGLTRISIFYQDDAFGMQGLIALTAALEAVNLRVLSKGTYAVNTINVTMGLNAIINDAFPFHPQAVFVWANNAAAAAFVGVGKQRLDPETSFFCCSFVGEGFIAQLPSDRTNVYVAQVFPTYNDFSYQVVSEYNAAMRAVFPSFTPSMVSLETYINTRVLARALLRIREVDLDRPESLLEVIYNIPVFVRGLGKKRNHFFLVFF